MGTKCPVQSAAVTDSQDGEYSDDGAELRERLEQVERENAALRMQQQRTMSEARELRGLLRTSGLDVSLSASSAAAMSDDSALLPENVVFDRDKYACLANIMYVPTAASTLVRATGLLARSAEDYLVTAEKRFAELAPLRAALEGIAAQQNKQSDRNKSAAWRERKRKRGASSAPLLSKDHMRVLCQYVDASLTVGMLRLFASCLAGMDVVTLDNDEIVRLAVALTNKDGSTTTSCPLSTLAPLLTPSNHGIPVSETSVDRFGPGYEVRWTLMLDMMEHTFRFQDQATALGMVVHESAQRHTERVSASLTGLWDRLHTMPTDAVPQARAHIPQPHLVSINDDDENDSELVHEDCEPLGARD